MKLTTNNIKNHLHTHITLEFKCECGRIVTQPFDLYAAIRGKGYTICPFCDRDIYLDLEEFIRFRGLVSQPDCLDFMSKLLSPELREE